jgi:hypothetical protein
MEKLKNELSRERRFRIDHYLNPVVVLVEKDDRWVRHHVEFGGRVWVIEPQPDGTYVGIVSDPSLQPEDLPWWWDAEIVEERP